MFGTLHISSWAIMLDKINWRAEWCQKSNLKLAGSDGVVTWAAVAAPSGGPGSELLPHVHRLSWCMLLLSPRYHYLHVFLPLLPYVHIISSIVKYQVVFVIWVCVARREQCGVGRGAGCWEGRTYVSRICESVVVVLARSHVLEHTNIWPSGGVTFCLPHPRASSVSSSCVSPAEYVPERLPQRVPAGGTHAQRRRLLCGEYLLRVQGLVLRCPPPEEGKPP